MGTIKIVVAPERDSQPSMAQTKGMFGSNAANIAANVAAEVDSKQLQQNLSQLVGELGSVLDNLELEQKQQNQTDGFRLKQFTVGVEISAKGGVSLVGKLEAGAKAAVSLVFERS
jgi:hypothetical protein